MFANVKVSPQGKVACSASNLIETIFSKNTELKEEYADVDYTERHLRIKMPQILHRTVYKYIRFGKDICDDISWGRARVELDLPGRARRSEGNGSPGFFDGTRKKDGLARTNNQKAPPVIISCQSSSFLAQSQPLRTYVAAPFKSAHVMHSTNDPLGELKRVSRIKHPAAGRSERNPEGIISVQ